MMLIKKNTEKSGKPVLENWQKAYENGGYLRSAELTEEQNYNMIDGRMNNLSQPVMENEIERKRK